MKQTIRIATLAIAAILATAPALAHHPMGGTTPQTLMHGLLSGFGHPIIGFDHLAFIVAVGLASAFMRTRWLPPLAFAGATVAGCLLFVGGVTLPLIEFIVTGSVVLVGGLVLSGKDFPAMLYGAIFALAGLFHGSAYAEAIIGAETTPLVAYLAGFAVIQYAIALAAGWLVRAVGGATEPQSLAPRLAGAVTAGIGIAFLAENIEALLFA